MLGASAPSADTKIEELRNQLYSIAAVWLDLGAEGEQEEGTALLNSLPEHQRAEVEERASIMEFDGGLDRDDAERAAVVLSFRNTKWRIQ